ncbi:MAG: carbohydrate ABC transporter permease [Anaerolineae bacterium]
MTTTTVRSGVPVSARRHGRLSAARAAEWRDFYVCISPWLIGFLVLVAAPMLASIYLSFTKYDILQPPKFVGLDNYAEMLFEDALFGKSLFVTAYYTVFSVPLGVIGSLVLALLLNQKMRTDSLFRTIYYLPSLTPAVASAVLWQWIFHHDIGLLNAALDAVGLPPVRWLLDEQWVIPAFVIVSLWQGVGGGRMIIFLAGLQGVPEHLYEAAKVDGANWWHRFTAVTIPMISPTLLFNLIMGIIGSFQVFTLSFLMTAGAPNNASLFYVLYLYRNAFQYLKMGYASALAWFLFLVLATVTLLQFALSGRWVYYEGGTAR